MISFVLVSLMAVAHAVDRGSGGALPCARALQIESYGDILRGGHAVAEFERLNSERPDDPDVLSFLSSAYAEAGRLPEAEATLHRRVEITGPSRRKLLRLVELAFENQNFAGAARYIYQALALDLSPEDRRQFSKLMVEASTELNERVRRLVREATKDYKLGEVAAAAKRIEELCTLDPQFSALPLSWAKTYSQTHQFKFATVFIELALRFAPPSPAIHLQAARIYRFTGRYEEALNQLNLASRIRGDRDQKAQPSRYARAILYEALGRVDELESLRAEYKIPADAEALELRIDLLKGNFHRVIDQVAARSMAATALPRIDWILAQAHYGLGNGARAIEYLGASIVNDPEHLEMSVAALFQLEREGLQINLTPAVENILRNLSVGKQTTIQRIADVGPWTRVRDLPYLASQTPKE